MKTNREPQPSRIMNKKTSLRGILFGLSITAAIWLMPITSVSAVLVVAENFNGLQANFLNTKVADTFNAAITTAGGSGTWAASTRFKQNGALTNDGGNIRTSANLQLGNYINNTKGTSNGQFDLTMTIVDIFTSAFSFDYLSLGFSSAALGGLATNSGFDFQNQSSVATIILRQSRDTATYGGVNLANTVVGPNLTGSRTFTVSLNLTPAGGYNGTSNFGTVTWSDSVIGNIRSFTYTAATDFNYIYLSQNSITAQIDNLTLTTVPEPSSLALLVGAFLCLVVMGRKISHRSGRKVSSVL